MWVVNVDKLVKANRDQELRRIIEGFDLVNADGTTGRVERAPAWMQRAGLEWFHRFLQAPRRLFRRYFIDDMVFLWLLIKRPRGQSTTSFIRERKT